MPTYAHRCEKHGEFDQIRPASRYQEQAPCPECKTPCDRVFRPSVDQLMVPQHFRTTLPTTGLKDNQGRGGEFENFKRDFNKWDSHCSGPRERKRPART